MRTAGENYAKVPAIKINLSRSINRIDMESTKVEDEGAIQFSQSKNDLRNNPQHQLEN